MTEPTAGPSHSSGRKRIPEPSSFLKSPMKKRSKRTVLRSNEKNIAINLYKLLNEMTATYPFKMDIIEKIAEVMGISKRTVFNIIQEYKEKGKVSSPEIPKGKKTIFEKQDSFVLSAIKRKVHQFYLNKELPTVDKILTAVNEDPDLPSFCRSTFYQILKKLKFSYMKRSRKSILLERPDLMAWRTNYLLKIKDYRKQNRKIYYTDETWLNEGTFLLLISIYIFN